MLLTQCVGHLAHGALPRAKLAHDHPRGLGQHLLVAALELDGDAGLGRAQGTNRQAMV